MMISQLSGLMSSALPFFCTVVRCSEFYFWVKKQLMFFEIIDQILGKDDGVKSYHGAKRNFPH